MAGPSLSHCMVDENRPTAVFQNSSTTSSVARGIRSAALTTQTRSPKFSDTTGAPRIHGELLKLGLTVSESTVAKYMRRHPRPPSQTWRTFLTNHASQIMAADLFVVPTVTFRRYFVHKAIFVFGRDCAPAKGAGPLG
jgi:hypothetical protein